MPRFLQLTSGVSGESLATKDARDEIMEALSARLKPCPFNAQSQALPESS